MEKLSKLLRRRWAAQKCARGTHEAEQSAEYEDDRARPLGCHGRYDSWPSGGVAATGFPHASSAKSVSTDACLYHRVARFRAGKPANRNTTTITDRSGMRVKSASRTRS